MTVTTSRRTFVGASTALAALALAPQVSFAHSDHASPESASAGSLLGALGLPVIEVTITGDQIDAPAEFAAGTVLLQARNTGDSFATIQFVQLPEGVTEDDLLAGIQPEAGIPAFAHQGVMTGGVDLEPGMSAEVAFDLTAGDWYIINVGETPSLVALTVTGDLAAVEIPATVQVEMSHHDFSVSGGVTAGPAIWQFTNVDPVLHHMILFSYPEEITEDDAVNMLLAMEGMASPVATLDPSLAMPAGFTGLISTGQTIYQEFNLTPATYFAVCFISDPGTEVPHVLGGMVEVFTVS